MAEELQAEQEAAPVEGAEPEQKAQEAGEVPAAEPPKTYTQADLDRIVAKVKKNARYTTKREIEAFYQGRDAGRPQQQTAAPQQEATEDAPPKREAFDSYEAYIEEKAAYNGRKAAREYREKAEQESQHQREQQTEARLLQDFQRKLTEKFPDLEDRAEAVAHIQMPPGMGRAIAESDLGPEILDNLIGNPKELERIAALSPSAAIREVGKLEARLEADAKKPAPPKTVTTAPTPIKPGGSLAAPPDSKPSDNDSIEEWMRKERARMRAKRA